MDSIRDLQSFYWKSYSTGPVEEIRLRIQEFIETWAKVDTIYGDLTCPLWVWVFSLKPKTLVTQKTKQPSTTELKIQ
jgi:hypothetical protein